MSPPETTVTTATAAATTTMGKTTGPTSTGMLETSGKDGKEPIMLKPGLNAAKDSEEHLVEKSGVIVGKDSGKVTEKGKRIDRLWEVSI